MEKLEKIKVIFLDMDGVLVYPSSQKRFDHLRDEDELKEVYKTLEEKFGIDYSQYDKYDFGASYWDIDKEAVAEIQRIIDATNAKIVVSSDWRTVRPPMMMKDLLTIHGLGEYVVDIIPSNAGYRDDPYDFEYHIDYKIFLNISDKLSEYSGRPLEILEYLAINQEIVENFVIIDDLDVPFNAPILKDNFVQTFPIIKEEDSIKAIEILNGTPNKLLTDNILPKRENWH